MDSLSIPLAVPGVKPAELACKDYKNLTPEVSFRRIYEYAGWRLAGGQRRLAAECVRLLPLHRL